MPRAHLGVPVLPECLSSDCALVRSSSAAAHGHATGHRQTAARQLNLVRIVYMLSLCKHGTVSTHFQALK